MIKKVIRISIILHFSQMLLYPHSLVFEKSYLNILFFCYLFKIIDNNIFSISSLKKIHAFIFRHISATIFYQFTVILYTHHISARKWALQVVTEYDLLFFPFLNKFFNYFSVHVKRHLKSVFCLMLHSIGILKINSHAVYSAGDCTVRRKENSE